MNKQEIELILKLLDIALLYGVPFAQGILNRIDKEVITKEDIDNLVINTDFEDY